MTYPVLGATTATTPTALAERMRTRASNCNRVHPRLLLSSMTSDDYGVTCVRPEIPHSVIVLRFPCFSPHCVHRTIDAYVSVLISASRHGATG